MAQIQTKVEKILDKVRPYIKMHGGDVELLGINKGTVTLKISGTCAHCQLADMTYNNLVAGLLIGEVPGIKDVVLEK